MLICKLFCSFCRGQKQPPLEDTESMPSLLYCHISMGPQPLHLLHSTNDMRSCFSVTGT
jgi:hypothetical protein